MQDLVIDNSMLSTFIACPMMYYLEYEKNWRKDYPSFAADWGTVIHAGLETYYKHQHELPLADVTNLAITAAVTKYQELFPDHSSLNEDNSTTTFNPAAQLATLPDHIPQRYDITRTINVLTDYIESHYRIEPFTLPPISVEQGFAHELLPGIIYCGKKDLVVPWSGVGNTIIDHKTTARYGKSNMLMNNHNAQGMGYIWSEFQQGNTDHVNFMLNWIVNRTNNFTFERNMPATYYVEDIQDWLTGVLWRARQLQQCHTANLWPRSTHTCYRHFGTCQFIDICFTKAIHDTKPPVGFKHHFWEPFKGARGVQTNA